jgi:hypothetical protein
LEENLEKHVGSGTKNNGFSFIVPIWATYVGQKLGIWARNMGKDVKLLGTTWGCMGTMWEQ